MGSLQIKSFYIYIYIVHLPSPNQILVYIYIVHLKCLRDCDKDTSTQWSTSEGMAQIQKKETGLCKCEGAAMETDH